MEMESNISLGGTIFYSVSLRKNLFIRPSGFGLMDTPLLLACMDIFYVVMTTLREKGKMYFTHISYGC